MSLILDILEGLWKSELNYKGHKVNFFGVPTFLIKNKNSTRATCYRLKKNHLIEKGEGGWRITPIGKKYIKEHFYLKSFEPKFKKTDPKNLLVIFDIPQTKARYRDWFRRQLKIYNFTMIQQSAWMGPSPLPRDFVEYVKYVGLSQNIKTFKLSKPFIDKNQ